MRILSPLNRMALVCQEWLIRATDPRLRKHFQESLGVPPATLSRWLTGETREPTKGTPDQIFAAFIDFVDRNGPEGDKPSFLDLHHETRAGLRKGLEASSDKVFMGLIAGRALPPSVRNLSDGNVTAAKAALLVDDQPTRYFVYRLGDFETGDWPEFSQLGHVARLEAKTLRRVPVLIDLMPREHFLVYRESYRNYTAMGSLFFVANHFTVWGQDDAPGKAFTGELFLIKICVEPIPLGPFMGLRLGTISMIGDRDAITSCKMLLRQAPANLQTGAWSDFAAAHQKTIVLKETKKKPTYVVDTDWSSDAIEERFISGLQFKDYANMLSIRNDVSDIVVE